MSINLKLSYLFILICCFSSIGICAQTGSIAGTIIDAENSQTLIGATVRVQGLSAVGTITDIDGRYRITELAPGNYTIIVSYVSYKEKSISDIEVKAGEVAVVDAVLETELANALGDTVVQIIYKRRQESLATGLTMVKQNIAISDVITRDIISRSPDVNVADVTKRMSGTTLVDGKFVVIRGLSDRYNIALVNGNLLPSSEPDRKTFSFDLIPSALLDNLFIYKTAQPNLPGDFAGGIILLNTRDIPDENFFYVSVGTGYNTLTTFKEYATYTGGATDWLGIDDGIRSLPADFPVNRDKFVDLTNTEKANLGKEFAPWGSTINPSSPLNQSYQFSGGIVTPVGKISEFGLIAALTYNNSNITTVSERNDYDNITDPIYEYNDNQYKNQILWGGLLNVSFKVNDNNKLSLKNSYTVNSADITTLRTGTNYSKAAYVQNEYYDFSSNQLASTILNGDHALSGSKVKIHWGAGINTLVRNQPDYRTVNYTKNISPAYDGDTLFILSPSPLVSPDILGIFYSYMEEKTYTGMLDLNVPFTIGEAKQVFSFGGFYLSKDRVFDGRSMGVATSNDIFMNPDYFNIISQPVNELLAPENFADSLFYINEITNPSDSYTATQTNKAAYAMFDNKIGKDLRIVWGIRTEFFTQILHSFFYSGGTEPIPVEVNTTESDSIGLPFDVLPSVNITYAVTEKMNIRLAGYKTVARPELRELATFGFYDIETNSSVTGNPFLIATDIYNADIRIEHFFKGPEFVSASFFYKKFNNPIGQRFFFGSIRELKPINDSVGIVLGGEFEFRKNLSFISKKVKFLEYLTFNTNLALIRSSVLLHVADTALAGTSERELQGQSDYVINFGFTYIHPSSGISATLLFNQIGPRISEYGNSQYPNIYENPRPLLDAQISVPFMDDKGTVKLNLSDIFSKSAIYYQDFNEDKKYDDGIDNAIRTIDNGAKISLSVNYKF